MAAGEPSEIEKILNVGDVVKLRVEAGQSQRSYNGWIAHLGENGVTLTVTQDSPLLLIGPGDFKVVMRKETDYALYLIYASARPKVGTRTVQLDLRILGEVQRIQRRWNVRLSVLIDPQEAMIIRGDEEKPFKTTILDLSAGGALLHTRESIPVGARLRLAFNLPVPLSPIDTHAEVIRVDRIDSEGWEYFRAGARFVNLSKPQEDTIIRFAFQEQLRRRRMERST